MVMAVVVVVVVVSFSFSCVLNVHLRFWKGEVNREGEEPKVERLVGCLGIQPGELRFVMVDLWQRSSSVN